MEIRVAKNGDMGFLIDGLEKNRIIEDRPKKDINARPSDIKAFEKGIKNKSILIAEENGRAVGFLDFRTNFKVMYMYDKFFWIDLIFVKEDFRGRGVGKFLYSEALRLADKKGFKKVVLDIFSANKNSTEFHTKLGFEPVYTIYQKKVED